MCCSCGVNHFEPDPDERYQKAAFCTRCGERLVEEKLETVVKYDEQHGFPYYSWRKSCPHYSESNKHSVLYQTRAEHVDLPW